MSPKLNQKWLSMLVALVMVTGNAFSGWAFPATDQVVYQTAPDGARRQLLGASDGGVAVAQFQQAQKDLADATNAIVSGTVTPGAEIDWAFAQAQAEATTVDLAQQVKESGINLAETDYVAKLNSGETVDLKTPEMAPVLAEVKRDDFIRTANVALFGPSGQQARVEIAPTAEIQANKTSVIDSANYNAPVIYLNTIMQLMQGNKVTVALYEGTRAEFFQKGNIALQSYRLVNPRTREPVRFSPEMSNLHFVTEKDILKNAQWVVKKAADLMGTKPEEITSILLRSDREGFAALRAALKEKVVPIDLAVNEIVTNLIPLMNGEVRQAEMAQIEETNVNYDVMGIVALGG